MAKEPICVCVINLKGGVGKSTIASLLARHGFFRRELDVLAVDLDPQANLSQAMMGGAYNKFLNEKKPSIVEVFNGYTPPSKSAAAPGKLKTEDTIHTVSEIDDRSLQVVPSRFDFSDNLTSALRPDPRVLAKFLAGAFPEKDLILVDCAPTESVLTQAAYHACGLVLVPVKPEYFATIGFPLLKESLAAFSAKNPSHEINVSGIVVNNGFYNGGNNGGPEKSKAIAEIRSEAKKNKWHIFKNEIPFSRGFPKMMRGDYNFQGNASRFPIFAEEFFDHIGL